VGKLKRFNVSPSTTKLFGSFAALALSFILIQSVDIT
jgi:hypothetical protein